MSVFSRFGLLALIVVCQLLAVCEVDAKAVLDLRRPERKTVTRLDEMVEWMAREQYEDGGFTWRNRIGFSAGSIRYRSPYATPAEVADTAIVGLALLRTNAATRTKEERALLAGCVSFVEQSAEASDTLALELSSQKSPFLVRIGLHADTFFALWLLAEVRDPGSPSRPDPLMKKLIAKIEKNINGDGSWGDARTALNSPLLGHAVGVRALETASRRGFKVNLEIVAKAEQYALSDAAKKLDEKTNGKWKPSCGGFREKWMSDVDLDDFEPFNEAFYLSAARLSVLDQADRSNALLEKRIRERLTEPASDATRAKIAQSLRNIVETRRTLARARGQMYAAYAKQKSFAPVMFNAEDFLAALLTVDAMSAAIVEEWFPPTVRELLQYQDLDGGLKIQGHISCFIKKPPPLFAPMTFKSTAFPVCPCQADRNMPSELCPKQRSFCARDRIFCTAAGFAILLADTPYREEFLNPKLVDRNSGPTGRVKSARVQSP